MRETFREREELYRPCIAEVVELECDGVPKVLEIRFDVVSRELESEDGIGECRSLPVRDGGPLKRIKEVRRCRRARHDAIGARRDPQRPCLAPPQLSNQAAHGGLSIRNCLQFQKLDAARNSCAGFGCGALLSPIGGKPARVSQAV